MNKDTLPEEDCPVYLRSKQVFVGVAEGGPEDGRIISSTSLTQFLPKPPRKSSTGFVAAYVANPFLGMTDHQIQEYQETSRKEMKQSVYDKMNPYRYDYDLQRKKWVFVEYKPSLVEDD